MIFSLKIYLPPLRVTAPSTESEAQQMLAKWAHKGGSDWMAEWRCDWAVYSMVKNKDEIIF